MLENLCHEKQIIDHFEFTYKDNEYSVDCVDGEFQIGIKEFDWYGQSDDLTDEEMKAIVAELTKHF
jgi:hypothetical protein